MKQKLKAFFSNRFIFLATMLIFAMLVGYDLSTHNWTWFIIDCIFLTSDAFIFADHTKNWNS
jgi:hypothetical protein